MTDRKLHVRAATADGYDCSFEGGAKNHLPGQDERLQRNGRDQPIEDGQRHDGKDRPSNTRELKERDCSKVTNRTPEQTPERVDASTSPVSTAE